MRGLVCVCACLCVRVFFALMETVDSAAPCSGAPAAPVLWSASLPRSDLRPKESASSFGTATTDRSTLSQYTRALEHDVVWHNATATMTRSLQHRSWPKSVQGVDEESWWPVPFRRLLGHEGVIWLPPLRPSFQLPFARAGFIRFWKRFGPRPLAALVRRVAIGY